MIDHVSVGVSDLGSAARFYEAAFAPLGFSKLIVRPTDVGFGKSYPEFWINLRTDMKPVSSVSGMHICLRAKTAVEVEAFHDAALKAAYATFSHLPGYKKNSKVNTEIIPFRDLKLGDRILANRGLTSIVGFGQVTRPYFFDEARSNYRHCVGVDWYDTTPRSLIPLRGSEDVKDFEFTTVKDLIRMQFEKLNEFSRRI